MSKTFKPTESELEILSILWEKQTATVREVHEIVQKTKDVGYTTTLKLIPSDNNLADMQDIDILVAPPCANHLPSITSAEKV